VAKATTDCIVIGRVLSPFGLAGAFKIFSHCRPKTDIFSYSHWTIFTDGHNSQQFHLEFGKQSGKYLIAKLVEVTTPEQAIQLRDCSIAVSTEQLKIPSSDQYYWYQIIGCTAMTIKNENLGVVKQFHETGANDVIEVIPTKDSVDNRTRLIPWVVDNTVFAVDIEQKIVTLDWAIEY